MMFNVLYSLLETTVIKEATKKKILEEK
jgi:hypothetical protein